MASVITAIGSAVAGTVSSIGTALGVGSAAAGTTAAAGTAAAGTAAAAGSGLTLGSVLTGVSAALSIGSALSAIGQGKAEAARLNTEAMFAQAQAAQEEAVGAARARDLAREYAELSGEQMAVQLANGLDIGVGTPVSVRESTKRLNERNLDVTRKSARNRAAMQRLRSRGLMSEAKASVSAGYGRAAGVAVDAIRTLG